MLTAAQIEAMQGATFYRRSKYWGRYDQQCPAMAAALVVGIAFQQDGSGYWAPVYRDDNEQRATEVLRAVVAALGFASIDAYQRRLSRHPDEVRARMQALKEDPCPC